MGGGGGERKNLKCRQIACPAEVQGSMVKTGPVQTLFRGSARGEKASLKSTSAPIGEHEGDPSHCNHHTRRIGTNGSPPAAPVSVGMEEKALLII